jgi:topoisomerase IA-like protein
MDLEDLKKSVSQMSDEEILKLLQDMRGNRRAAPAKRQARKQEAAIEKKLEKVEKKASALSIDEINELLTMLKEETNGTSS